MPFPMFLLQRPVERPMLPLGHGILMRCVMLRVKRIVFGLMLLIEIVVHPGMGTLIVIVIVVIMGKNCGRKRKQAGYWHGEQRRLENLGSHSRLLSFLPLM